MWSVTHFDVFEKVNSPRFVGKLTSKVNSRSEYATKILLVLWCKIIEGLIWVLVNSLVVPLRQGGSCKATWNWEFKLSWREAGPPRHHDEKVDSDQ